MTRDEIEALLPFLANDTLEGEERAEVEAAVAADATLATELAALKLIRAQMRDESVQGPGEFGLARLNREIEREEQTTRMARWQGRGLLQLAAALVIAVMVGGYLLTGGQEPGGYELAGEAPAIMVSFAENTTEAEIRATLLAAGVVIVDGPSALGFYGLAPLPDVDLATAEETLRAAEGIVTSVEVAQ